MKLGDYQLCHNGCQFSWYDNDELVAMVELKEENGIKWICGVYVSPSYRNHGIGMQLLQFSTILGGEKLRVSKSNEAALRFQLPRGQQRDLPHGQDPARGRYADGLPHRKASTFSR